MAPRWRLFPKYALLIISLVGAMLIASGAISIYFSWRESRQNLIALQDEKAQAAASRIEQYILDIEHQLGWTALPMLDAGGSPLEQRRIEYLKLLRQVPAITEVAWLDPSGHEQLRISRLAMDAVAGGADRSQEPRFKVASGGATYYGPVYFRKETEPYMTIARPAGSGGGVTAVEVNLKFVWDVVSRIRIGVAGLAYVVDARGTLIAHPDISLVLKKTELKDLPQVAASLRAKEPPATARDLTGGEVLSAHAMIPALRWSVFVESPVAEAFAPLYASILRAALLLGAGLLVSTGASFFVARALVRPLRALQEGAARIGAGELDRRIEVKTGDELEGLAEQFNRMGLDLKASYTGLERKVEARTAELTEALDYQTAISEVLRVISRSPTDVAPVFEAILASATRLFGDPLAAVMRFDGELVHLVATCNWSEEAVADAKRLYPAPPNPHMVSGRVILSGQVQIENDALSDPAYDHQTARAGQWRRMIGAPLLKDGTPIGAIVVAWRDPGPVPQRQADLLKTFADQAVIAIENVRLLNETKEALEQQTATAEVLSVISGSVADSGPVFEKILASCAHLFASSEQGVLLIGDDERIHLGAHRGQARARLEGMFPVPQAGGLLQSVAARRVLHYRDVLNDADVPDGIRRVAERIGIGSYSQVFAPMLWEGRAIGSLYVTRQPATGFTEKEIGLLRTFADQAVIAIQNARLFHETREALDRQTATSDILRVISESPTDVQPVLEAVADRSGLLCRADGSRVWLPAGDQLRAMTGYKLDDGTEAGRGELLPLRSTSVVGRAFLEARTVHVDDVAALIESDYPDARGVQGRHGFRTVLAVPMLRDGTALGTIGLVRRQVRPFSKVEIDLVQTFADQAVIAMENVRLFNETKEALEQQTATAEVLQVISGSVSDAKPVFDTILDSCKRLFAATGLGIYLVDAGERLQLAAFRGNALGSATGSLPRPLEGTATAIAIRERRVVHYPDVLNGADVPEPLRRIARTAGNYSIAFAPMLWEERGVGAIQVARDPPVPFTDKELALLKTFADQAVIAIQNSNLFNEIQAKGRELELANKHKSEFLANMSHELRTPLNAIIGFSEVLSEQMFGEVNEKQLEYLLDIHSSGHHLLTLINDILDLSKIEAGRMELELSSFDLGMLLDNAMTLVRERANRQGLTLALDVDERIEEWVADQRKVKQVVINLLSNAVKFTPASGRVTLRARPVEDANGRAVEIAVIDTGVGIAADQQALVFEEFRQASGDYLRKTEGTGLGLSLAKRFVELHGGTIRVESAPGRGSTFAFILPQRVPEPA